MLLALQDRRQFILYRLVPRANGRTDKIPTDQKLGTDINAQDPVRWMFAHEALEAARLWGDGYGVGLVLFEGCGLFCIDIDHAFDPAERVWTPIAQKLFRQFAGCAIEISASGQGAHIFGTLTEVEPHRSRNSEEGIECYTKARFIALTGVSLVGDVTFDATAQFKQCVAEYFAPHAVLVDTAHDGPVPEWSGPADDDVLIEKALNARESSYAIFGDKASFKDLWLGNSDALERAYAGDESMADMALAQHLAYWTGNDQERMLRLMQRSALVRPKWDRHDYLPRTIERACSRQTRWYKAPSPPPPPLAATGVGPDTTDTAPGAPAEPVAPRPPGTYVRTEEMRELWKGMAYVTDVNAIYCPDDGYVKPESTFNNTYGDRWYQMTVDGSKPSKNAWEAAVRNPVFPFPKVHELFFDPSSEPGCIVERYGRRMINTWRPLEIYREPGDVTPFIRHMQITMGDDWVIFDTYLKAVVRFQGRKFSWAPLLQGVEGNGKSFFSKVMSYCIGQPYVHGAKANELASRFNSVFYGKILITVEDIKVVEDASSVWEALKPMITEDRMEIEAKGVDKVSREVCFNFIFNSNHKDAIRKTKNDRRIAPFFARQQQEDELERDGLTNEYFIKLWDWAKGGGYAHIAHYLWTDPIDERYNPAGSCIRAPLTSSTQSAIESSRGSIEQEVLESIETKTTGFCGGYLCSTALDTLIQSHGKSRFFSPLKKRALAESLGFIPHPGLPAGRLTHALPDGKKPILYVRKGSPQALIQGASAIRNDYINSQKQEI